MNVRPYLRNTVCVTLGALLAGFSAAISPARAADTAPPAKPVTVEAPADGAWETLADGSTGQTTEFEGAGGIKIPAYVRKPAGQGPFPVVVMIHGAEASKNGTYGLGRRMASPTADFVGAGFAVYSIDFRPKETIPAPGTVPQGADPILQDAIKAVAKARSYPFVDPKRVAIMGGSRGGQLMARVTTRVDASGGILCAPAGLDMIEISKVVESGQKINPALKSMVKALERRTGTNITEIARDPAKYNYHSPVTDAAQVRFPLLLISGRNDVSSPIPPLEAYAKKLRESGKQVETYFPDNGPHGFYYGFPQDIPETKEAAQRAVAFLRKCFAGKPDKS